MKSIRTKIQVVLLAVILVTSISLGVLGGVLNYNASMSTLKAALTETADIAAARIEYEIRSYSNIAREVGCLATLADDTVPLETKRALISQRAENSGFQRGNLVGLDGTGLLDGNNYADRGYFQAALKGEISISDPVVSKATGKLTFVVAAPLWEGGVPGTTVKGVVYFIPSEEFLNEIVRSIQVGQTGSAYILDNSGLTIAHKNSDIVGVENTIEAAKTDRSLSEISTIEQRMVNGENDFAYYSYGGQNKVMSFAPIPGTNGWSVGITAEQNEFLAGVQQSVYSTIGLVVIFVVVGIIISIRFASSITKPLILCTERIKLMAKGDVSTPAPKVSSKDETGVLAESLDVIIQGLSGVAKDEVYLLGEMADGNFRVQSKARMFYVGDFAPVADSIDKILLSLNRTMTQISQSSEQVAGGAYQMSSGAQALAQGATEQASSVEELSATIQEIGEQVRSNATNASEAQRKTQAVGEQLEHSNTQMQNLIDEMSAISRSSSDIGRIIKTIEDIAFQTNILALNAAVEAARAGAAGRGFAVVADEVRNLASKSAEAAKNTTALITQSIQAVAHGSSTASETAISLLQVVEGAMDITRRIEEISKASNDQSSAIAQVSLGVGQISSVVQTNSATAQESAAASEELSSQAQILKELVAQFRLTEESGRLTAPSAMPTAHHNTATREPMNRQTPIPLGFEGVGSKY